MTQLELHTIQKLFKKRESDAHKGNHGHALIIAGSSSKMGAAIIASKASLRAGVGLLTVSIPKEERLAIFTSVPEAMVAFSNEEINYNQYTAVAIGPGIGKDESAVAMLKSLMANFKLPTVFDADALNILAEDWEALLNLPEKSILTPHGKEFDRLYGNHNTDSDRKQTAIAKAKELKHIIVLKGHKTFITNGENSFENTTGNSGLAKGGSGDALTGIITAFLAQNYEPLNAALLGVYIHGLAADITLQNQSSESMLITDVIENLGKAFAKIQK